MVMDAPNVTSTETDQPTIRPLNGYQTSCDAKNEKGKPCWGFLKIWYGAPDELTHRIPRDHVIYRCQKCGQLYHGPPHRHVSRSWRKMEMTAPER